MILFCSEYHFVLAEILAMRHFYCGPTRRNLFSNLRSNACEVIQAEPVMRCARRNNREYFEIFLSTLMRLVILRNFDRAHEELTGVVYHQILARPHSCDHQFRRIFYATIVQCNPLQTPAIENSVHPPIFYKQTNKKKTTNNQNNVQ